MKSTQSIAAGLIGALLLGTTPASVALADGAASTRNILFGIGAAAGTLIIINHNKKVHQKYAEDAAKQAALQEQANNAQAAAQQYKTAYQHELAVADAYKKEVAIQKDEIARLNSQLAVVNPSGSNFAAKPSAATVAQAPAGSAKVVSYGWGDF